MGLWALSIRTQPPRTLVQAIREAAAGRRFLSPRLSSHSIVANLENGNGHGVENPLENLTSREREVIEMGATGRTNADIGEKLSISPRTVEIHRANAMKKLGLKSQSDLVKYAILREIIPGGP